MEKRLPSITIIIEEKMEWILDRLTILIHEVGMTLIQLLHLSFLMLHLPVAIH